MNRQGGEGFEQLLADLPEDEITLPFYTHSKCYTLAAAHIGVQEGNDATFREKWSLLYHIGVSLYIMVRYDHGVADYAPLFTVVAGL